VPTERSPEPLLTIGEFARLTQLTTKALRIYDESGLLCPARVDQTSGYRYYNLDHARVGRLIGSLSGDRPRTGRDRPVAR
jgi:DNA-binding transcriptional MerR regulator